MPSQAIAPARAPDSEVVSRLAKFFPDAAPVRIPIRLRRPLGSGSHGNRDFNGHGGWALFEETVIEFGTPREALFSLKQPLEFADVLLVETIDGTLRAEASVVAVQYHPDRTVVAARFLKYVPNWIVKS